MNKNNSNKEEEVKQKTNEKKESKGKQQQEEDVVNNVTVNLKIKLETLSENLLEINDLEKEGKILNSMKQIIELLKECKAINT